MFSAKAMRRMARPEKIALQGWSPDFHGSWVKPLDAASADGGELPEGNGTAALVNTAYAARYVPNAKGKLGYTTALPKWTALELSSEEMIRSPRVMLVISAPSR